MLADALPRGLSERLLSLGSFSLLSGLPSCDLVLLARLARERDFDVGQTLAREGEPVDMVQLLLSGRARLSRRGVEVDGAGPFDTVGLLSVAAGIGHRLTAVAAEPIHALEIDGDFVDEVLEEDYALFVRVLRLAAASARRRRNGAVPDVLTRLSPATDDAALAGGLLGPIGAAHKLLLLRQATLFRTAPIDGLAAFAKRLEPVCLPAGASLETGGRHGQLSFVATGSARVSAAIDVPDAGAPAAAFVPAEAGDVVGGLDALTPSPPRLLIRATTEVHLLCGAAADLLDAMEDHHDMGRRLLAEMLDLAIGQRRP